MDKGTGVVSTHIYDAVLVCSGINGIPNKPHIERLDKYRGTVIHSKEFESGSQLAGQSVLVVGNASSGCDVAYLAAENTEKVLISSELTLHLNYENMSVIFYKTIRFYLNMYTAVYTSKWNDE